MSSSADTAAASWPGAAELRALAAGLVGPELILFPVRHHSPACAWQLRRLLETRPVSAVLVEGPASFDALIPHLVHAQAVMPLAIYTYVVFKSDARDGGPRQAAYYPFCEHSPELLALRHAAAAGLPVQFIDAEFADQCQAEHAAPDSAALSLQDEGHLGRSRFLSELAARQGCRDHEELWEHLFEISAPTRSLEEHVAAVAAYCALARTEYTQAELAADGTLVREAEMARHIRAALARRAPGQGPVLAVLGGFHAVALPALLAQASPLPAAAARPAPADSAAALIRYSFERLDQLNGYASGMPSPAWQQALWDSQLRHAQAGLPAGPRVRRELALKLLFDIAAELRARCGIALPLPTLSGAYEHTLRLAALRGRPAPAREDLLDACLSCFVKGEADGDGAIVLAVARRLLCGHAVGSVPPGTARPPLLRDFETRARRLRLKIDSHEPRRAVLDLYRRGEHRSTSRLLHGLALLGVPFATRSGGPDFVRGAGLARLQEHWEYRYTAATEAALVEASLYGTTLPEAVATRFDRKLDALQAATAPRDARAAAALLCEACVLGLHDRLARVAGVLAAAVAEDAAFESLAAAASTLGLLWEGREPLEARALTELPALLKTTFARAIFLGRDLRGAAGDGSDLAGALAQLHELLASAAGSQLDAELYWSMLAAMAAEHALPLVRGAATGLLYGAGRIAEAEMARAVAGHLNGSLASKDAVSFLRGLLKTAREAAWQQAALLQLLDELLQGWDEPAFVSALPELRLAFADMTPKETERIALAVAGLHGQSGLGPLVQYDIDAGELQAHLALSQQLLEQLRADGLAAWIGA
ncbi:MAG: hypothetical protein KF778_17555 [Rhodocyclaceae bacterium]|nr:hypothetical protein [Rhodocyclaceae bacterium]MBX3670210.1 hypothetical protein [Rhodocyclaceae bacterium]